MTTKILPIEFSGVTEKVYSGFWQRFGAFWVDILIYLPITISIPLINNLARLNYLYTIIPSYLFFFFYSIYLVKRWGGTPGKLICGIIITKKNGKPIGWREAVLRHIVNLLVNIPFIVLYMIALFRITDSEFLSVSGIQRSSTVMEHMPIDYRFFSWLSQIWIWSEFFVMLTNYRRRALHDFLAGTVVIKKKYRTIAEEIFV